MMCIPYDSFGIVQAWLDIFHTSPVTALVLLAAFVGGVLFILVVIFTKNPGAPK